MSQPPVPPPPPGYGPGYGWPPGYGVPPFQVSNGKATASLVTGITTLVLSWCCGLGLLGIVAIVLGFRARSEIRASGGAQRGDGRALGGIVTGLIAVVFGALVLAFVIWAVAAGFDYRIGEPEPNVGTSF